MIGTLLQRWSLAQPTTTWRHTLAVARVVHGGWMTQGPRVEAFEYEFAKFMDVDPRRVVACVNGTAALTVLLMARVQNPRDHFGLTRRTEYIMVPTLTYAGTLNAVFATGLVPMLVDVEADTWCMSARTLNRSPAFAMNVTNVLPVHLYGYLSDVTPETVGPGWTIIEDACEALGARDTLGRAGMRGDGGAFSLFANKQVSSCGEGGVIVAPTPEVADRCRVIRGQGQSPERYVHDEIGVNARMMEVQAAYALESLRLYRKRERAHRGELLAHYRTAFRGSMVTMREPVSSIDFSRRMAADPTLNVYDAMKNVDRCGWPAEAPWLCAIRLPFDVVEAKFCERLADVGIESRHMFRPMHQQKWHAEGMPGTDRFPVANRLALSVVALPLHAGLTELDVYEIASRTMEQAEAVQDEQPEAMFQTDPWGNAL